MIDSLIAYDPEDIKREAVVSQARTWLKSGVISQGQFESIKSTHQTQLFKPTFFIRVLLFIASYVGLSMLSGLGALMFHSASVESIRVICGIIGVFIIIFLEAGIREGKHFRSGAVEAAQYAAGGFLFYAVVGPYWDIISVYYGFFFVLCSVTAIRYLNRLTLVGALYSLMMIVFDLCSSNQSLIPFVEATFFICLYLLMERLKKRLDPIIWGDHVIVFQATVLLMIYFSLNYFVVRELSVELMGLELNEGDDIPFAFLFYAWTILLPLGYLIYGIRQKSLLFIRVSLLTLALGVFTIKYYYSLGHPEVTITIAGALLILVAILLLRYLKEVKRGFTREQLLTDKWSNTDVSAFIVSQTLGGHQIDESRMTGNGGEFGGGGASGDF